MEISNEIRRTLPSFKKCDLHVHSSSCYSRTYSKKDFFEALLATDLDVVAITDHNSVDVRLLEELHGKIPPAGRIVLAGVEVNVRLKNQTIEQHGLVLAEGPAGEYFHGIIWCSYDNRVVLRDAIDQLFLDAEAFTQTELEEADQNDGGRAKLSKKTEGIAVYLEDLQEKLALLPHFFVFHENKGSRNLSDYLPNKSSDGVALITNQTYKDRLFYYSHALAVEGGEKSHKHISAWLEKDLNNTLAALFFSDANGENIKIGDRYTWIDFDGDLDSLLLAISDPESRIRTSDVSDEFPQTNAGSYLECVSFDLMRGVEKEKVTIEFAPGFNGIVGARGSGKTMLAKILCGAGLANYSSFVDQSSVKYKLYGGQPTSNVPKVLSLEQGELEGIYSNGSYAEVPLLEKQINAVEQRAKQVALAVSSLIGDLLDNELTLAKAFIKRYPSGAVKPDVLDSSMPSGLLVSFPDDACVDDAKIAREMSSSLEKASGFATELVESLKEAKPGKSSDESSVLFEAFAARVTDLEQKASLLSSQISALRELSGKVKDVWFVDRSDLREEFLRSCAETNAQQDSAALSNYNKDKLHSEQYLVDLLRLRLALKDADAMIEEQQTLLKQPLSPIRATAGEDSLEIRLSYEAFNEYESAKEALLSPAQKRKAVNSPIAECCIRISEPSEAKAIFNGQRIRLQSPAKGEAYLGKYVNALKSDVADVGSLEKKVSLNGKLLDEMSPGMRAEALLKLFLQDEVARGDYDFIVIDQPEDNLDTETISRFLIDRLKSLKLHVQLFVVSHSAPVIVNGDARNVIVCTASDENGISYETGTINGQKTKQSISNVLDGGERYLKMRLNKYNFQPGGK